MVHSWPMSFRVDVDKVGSFLKSLDSLKRLTNEVLVPQKSGLRTHFQNGYFDSSVQHNGQPHDFQSRSKDWLRESAIVVEQHAINYLKEMHQDLLEILGLSGDAPAKLQAVSLSSSSDHMEIVARLSELSDFLENLFPVYSDARSVQTVIQDAQ